MTKQELRRSVRAEKHRRASIELERMSDRICDRVLASAIWQEAGTLLLYYPLSDEVDVRRLIREADALGKRVLLPVCRGEELELRVYEGEASLSRGAFGIMEPQGAIFPEEQYADIRLAVVPGMAFDREGHRLGRGKGYYDRLLPRLSHAHLMGVCFPFQLQGEVPAEKHDVSIHEVISI